MRTCATVKHRRGLVSMAWGGDVVEGGTQKNLDSASATIIINNYYYFKTPFLQKVRGRGIQKKKKSLYRRHAEFLPKDCICGARRCGLVSLVGRSANHRKSVL